MSSQGMDALIVRNAVNLENAADRINNHIDEKIFAAIDSIIEEWVKDSRRQWIMNKHSDAAYAWMAPNKWRIPKSDRNSKDFFCKFSFEPANADEYVNIFYLTSLCNLKGGSFGFAWVCEHRKIGMNRSAWKKFLQGKIATFQKLGFNYQEKSGIFFVPAIIDQEKLAVAIEGDNIDDALEPVRGALDAIDKAWISFDGLLERAIPK